MSRPILSKTNDGIFLDGKPVYFHAEENYFNANEVEVISNSDGSLKFIVKSFIPVTMVLPVCDRKIILGDNFNETHLIKIRKYFCPGTTSILSIADCEKIFSPIIHLIKDDAWSISTTGECIISLFHKFYEQYISIVGVPINEESTFFLDIAQNHRVNLQRHYVHRRQLSFAGCLELDEMKTAIYYGADIENPEPNFEFIWQNARKIQDIFWIRNLYSVIIGSAAEMLNGIKCSVCDVDFMLKDKPSMRYASEILKERDFKIIYEDYKLIKMSSGKVKIDLTFDNYNLLHTPFNVTETNGCRFFNTQGLMWLCLLNIYESTYNDNQYPRNKKAIYELTKHAMQFSMPCNTKLGHLWYLDETKTKNCIKMCEIIRTMKLDFQDIRINDPFKVNCFSDENSNFIYSVISTGENINDFRIITPQKHTTAIWLGIDGSDVNLKKEDKDSFSFLFGDRGNFPGIVIATNREITNDSLRKEYKI